MNLTRRDLIKIGLQTGGALGLGARLVHAQEPTQPVNAAPDPAAVWKVEKGILVSTQQVRGDACWVPRQETPAQGNFIEATFKVDQGDFLAIILNSYSAMGPRYVVLASPQPAQQIRVFELMYPNRDWAIFKAPVELGKQHKIQLRLNNSGITSHLDIWLDDTTKLSCVLPAKLKSFYEPGLLAVNALGQVIQFSVSDNEITHSLIPVTQPDFAGHGETDYIGQNYAEFGAWFQNEIRAIREEFKVPALACAIVGSSEVVAATVNGVRRHGTDIPVTLDDQFHLGSCTKSMTTSLLALLVQRGQLRWDHTLGELLPDIADSMHPDFHRMPLMNIVHQSSGITGCQELWNGNSIKEQRTNFVKTVLSVPPTFPIGSKYEYRNDNFIVAGAIAERFFGGESYESAIRTHLFSPLGITTSGYGPMGLPNLDLQPSSHHLEGGVIKAVWFDNPAVLGPAGTQHMSILDFARYAQWHLAGMLGQPYLLSAEMFRQLHHPILTYAKGWVSNGPDEKGLYDLWHNGSNTLNSADMHIKGSRGLAVVTMCNDNISDETGNGGKALGAVANRVLEVGIRKWFDI